MASTPASDATVPTASTKKMRVRSKSTSSVDDMKDVSMEESKPKFQGFKRPMKNGINGIGKEENLFVRAPKDRLGDRKSRSGRRGLPKKGQFSKQSFLLLSELLAWHATIYIS